MNIASPFRSKNFFLPLLLLVSSLSFASPSAVITEARQYLADGDAAQAFATLESRESEFAGDVEFDYWLGLTANRAGKSGRALFSLERVLAQRPQHAAARLELAIVYARLNQGDAARRELNTLEGQNPPPAALAQINELRHQLGLGDQARRLGKRVAYVSLETGHDDNVGNWPKDFGFPGFETPNPVDSAYGSLAAGVRQSIDIQADQKLLLSLNGMVRKNNQDNAEQFDQDFLTARAEWVKDMDGRREFAIAGDAGMLRLDGESYHDFFGLEAEWREQRNERTRVLFTLGLRDMNFELDTYDVLLSRLRGGARYQLNQQWRFDGDFTLEYEAQSNDRPGGDSIRAGVRGAANWQYRPTERASIDASFTRTDYTRNYPAGLPFNGENRNDDRWGVGVQWDKTFQRLWQVRARVQYRDQNSSLTTYTFDQTSGSVSLTRYF
ncbi:MAG: hypothetical protein CVV10_04690 [Gammaproteobacteria bacterium HGW-Gammaproteobacteria-14]|nr:MAG: hypothetical protein CVV10_04690 [Gammaproteobacteria bacterium HGW-Gammaproteobacteria-14]